MTKRKIPPTTAILLFLSVGLVTVDLYYLYLFGTGSPYHGVLSDFDFFYLTNIGSSGGLSCLVCYLWLWTFGYRGIRLITKGNIAPITAILLFLSGAGVTLDLHLWGGGHRGAGAVSYIISCLWLWILGFFLVAKLMQASILNLNVGEPNNQKLIDSVGGAMVCGAIAAAVALYLFKGRGASDIKMIMLSCGVVAAALFLICKARLKS